MPWRWREQREGEAGMKHEWKEGETVEKESVCVRVYVCVHGDKYGWGFVERNHNQLHLYSSHYRPTEIRAVVC